MTNKEVTDLAIKLIAQYPHRSFDISMADQADYDLMRATLARLGRKSGPDGEFFVVRVAEN
jgi:hypothetical protein